MSELTSKSVKKVISKLENNEYKIYFYCPDFDKPSGGVGLIYDHVKVLVENGFNAVVLHNKSGFVPEWLGPRLEGVPVEYQEDSDLILNIEDFFMIPEGFPQLMDQLQKSGAPCKKIVFCQNWYYVLNALPVGVTWGNFGIDECLSVSKMQSQYLKMIMPYLKLKEVYGSIDNKTFTPPKSLADKKPIVSFIPSRDGGTKSSNVIKTFYQLFPYFRWIQFNPLVELELEDFSEAMRKSAFYCHFDEYSSWGTAPIEAFLSKCLVAGWDGFGGKEYMKSVRPDTTDGNSWVAPNGDIIALAFTLGNMIETWVADEVPEYLFTNMELACSNYTVESEKDSIIRAYNEYREERIAEIEKLAKDLEEQEKAKKDNKDD